MKKILVVDDNEQIRDVLTVLLTNEGYHVMTVHDGVEALRRLRTDKPDLIVMDLMMPGLDGYQASGMILHNSAFKDIPLVVFSALSDDQSLETSAALGIRAHIVKGASLRELVSTIKDILSQPASQKDMYMK